MGFWDFKKMLKKIKDVDKYCEAEQEIQFWVTPPLTSTANWIDTGDDNVQ